MRGDCCCLSIREIIHCSGRMASCAQIFPIPSMNRSKIPPRRSTAPNTAADASGWMGEERVLTSYPALMLADWRLGRFGVQNKTAVKVSTGQDATVFHAASRLPLPLQERATLYCRHAYDPLCAVGMTMTKN